jgi:hypothetical protein
VSADDPSPLTVLGSVHLSRILNDWQRRKLLSRAIAAAFFGPDAAAVFFGEPYWRGKHFGGGTVIEIIERFGFVLPKRDGRRT